MMSCPAIVSTVAKNLPRDKMSGGCAFRKAKHRSTQLRRAKYREWPLYRISVRSPKTFLKMSRPWPLTVTYNVFRRQSRKGSSFP